MHRAPRRRDRARGRPLPLTRSRARRGTLILAGGLDTAEAWLEQGKADVIAFGRKFIANPDLPERFRSRAPSMPTIRSLNYGGGAKGYTDYPTLAQERSEQPKPCVDNRWR